MQHNIFNQEQSVNSNETLIALWFQTGETTVDDSLDLIESKIENAVDSLKRIVYNEDSYQKQIFSLGNNTKIFMILSNKCISFARVLENIHNLPMIHSIYIHDEKLNIEEINKYSKVVNIYRDWTQLTDQLCTTVQNYIRHAHLPMTILKQRHEQDRTTNLLNKFAYFIDFWNPLFIDLLLDLPFVDYEQEKHNFLAQCRLYYRANSTMLKNIDDFAKTYRSHFAIFWYKSDSFISRLLNKAMRQYNIEGILLIRFFILDLYKQLNATYEIYIEQDRYIDNSCFYVYRGQLMFTEEVNYLKQNLTQNTIISVTSFFSASRNIKVALTFSGTDKHQNNQTQKHVLFKIEINIDHKNLFKRKPFADVGTWINKDQLELDEREVLFMAGSFFQINQIIENKRIDESDDAFVTLVEMKLINETNTNLPILNDYQILKSTKTVEGKIIRIGNLLIDQSLSLQLTHSKVDSYYKALLENNLPTCRTGQAWVALKRKQYDIALKLAFEALSMDDKQNKELTITILNCLGGIYSMQNKHHDALKYYSQAFNISKPTDDEIENKIYEGPCIRIDKFAMYDNYRNIASINKACTHQKLGQVEQAWNTYREAVDYEMRQESTFHCHTCMTIAEAGTYEANNQKWTDWKRFLDLGICDLLKYSTSAITGYLSFSHEYDFSSRRYNNSYCREQAISYFSQVESYCEPKAKHHNYYLYTLQCYERLAELYQYQLNRAIEYYEKMIKLCQKYQPNDLDNLIIAYKRMIEVYEKRQTEKIIQSENISTLICGDEMTNTTILPVTYGKICQSGIIFENFNPLNFAFDRKCYWLDSLLNEETDFTNKIIYCKMKLAVLLHAQQKSNDARKQLNETIVMCQSLGPRMNSIVKICKENIDFLDNRFDSIIQSYKNRLITISQHLSKCIDENISIYIAHLYAKQKDFNSACQCLQEALFNFEQYDYICIHTIDCYLKLIQCYQAMKNDKESIIGTYKRCICLMKRHRSEQMRKMITIIEDIDLTVPICKTLCNILRHDTSDLSVLYKYLQQILETIDQKPELFNVIINIYEKFLQLLVQISNPLPKEISMILIHFEKHAANAYTEIHDLSLSIEIYHKLITLLLKPQNDTTEIIEAYKLIASKLVAKHFLNESAIMYEDLLDFICHFQSMGGFREGDLIDFVDYAFECKIINEYCNEMKFNLAIELHYKMIQFLEYYQTHVQHEYDLDDFRTKILKHYDCIAHIYQFNLNDIDQMMKIYQKEIDFLSEYDVEGVQERINTIFSNCQQSATNVHSEQAIKIYESLIVFITSNRLDYLSDFSSLYCEFIESRYSNMKYFVTNEKRMDNIKRRIADYKQKAQSYFNVGKFDKARQVYAEELLPFLLEYQAHDDEQIAICYMGIASLENEQNIQKSVECYQQVIDIYEKQTDSFYTEYAFKLNQNVCRRYAGKLFHCYHHLTEAFARLKHEQLAEEHRQKALNIIEKYSNQFDHLIDPITHEETLKIRSFVELYF